MRTLGLKAVKKKSKALPPDTWPTIVSAVTQSNAKPKMSITAPPATSSQSPALNLLTSTRFLLDAARLHAPARGR